MRSCLFFISGFLILSLFSNCAGKQPAHPIHDSVVADDDPHADNDIAMTVSSIADALNVGEKLDDSYDFTGVLTDGSGRPLYTDTIGNPGDWNVDVMSPDSVVISSLYPGDLLPEDLTDYIVESLNAEATPDTTLFKIKNTRIVFIPDSLSRIRIEIVKED